MLQMVILAGAVGCAIMAIRSARLLVSAIWLAGTSALAALAIYLLGAPEIAVIELSVGAGLVTVLFVFAINIAGEESLDARPVVPRPLAWALAAVPAVLLAGMALARLAPAPEPAAPGNFSQAFWELRGLDMLVQVALIYAGVLGVLGLLSEPRGQKGHAQPAVSSHESTDAGEPAPEAEPALMEVV